MSINILEKLSPKSIDDFVFNKKTKSLIEFVLSGDHNLFLIKGTSGSGKTSLAKLFGITRGATDYGSSIVEINCGQNAGIDDVRNFISSEILQKSMLVETKVVILDEAHRITEAAQNGLLIPTQNIPENVYVFLCSTSPEKIIPTIRNRCQEIDLSINQFDDIFYKSLENRYFNVLKIVKEETNKQNIDDNLYKIVYQKLINAYIEENVPFSVRKFTLNLYYLLKSNIEAKNEEELDLSSISLSCSDDESEDISSVIKFLSGGLVKHKYEADTWPLLMKRLNKVKLNPEQIRIYLLKYFYSKLSNDNTSSLNSAKISNVLNILNSFTKFGSFDFNDGKYKMILSFRDLFVNSNSMKGIHIND